MPLVNSCWHNRYIISHHGTWATARNGANHILNCGYQRPTNLLKVHTSLVAATYYINRDWLFFNTQGIPTVTAARLGIYVTAKVGVTSAIYITKGLSREPIDENDWPTQTDEVTNLGQFNLVDLVPNQYNWADLNAAGIAWLNLSPLELKQGESSDCERTHGFAIFAPFRVSQSRFPQSSATITTLKLRLRRRGAPGTFYVDIHAADAQHKPTGPVLASGSINGNTLTTVTWGLWYEIDLGAGFTPTAGQEYCTVGYILAGNATNYVDWRGSPAGMYVNGYCCYSDDNGASFPNDVDTDQSNIDYEAVSVGGTNFCLRTESDVNNWPPGPGVEYSATFYSAQKGDGYLPILDLTYAGAASASLAGKLVAAHFI